MTISGRSSSTITCYSHHLAKIALYYNLHPMKLSLQQIEEYLFYAKDKKPSPSDSYFKFAVYSLRFAYRLYGLKDRYIEMPAIKHNKKLPVVLSKTEVIRLLSSAELPKHRVLLNLLYGCGLRCFEVRNIRISDLDFDRQSLHIREGKFRKDRYVPLSPIAIDLLKEYISTKKKSVWLFGGKPIGRAGGDFDARYSAKGVQWAVKHLCAKAEITKKVSVHTLRHTFATHLLEDGLDIVTIKELLGHEKIETTMVYLHVAQCGKGSAFSPLDTLYGLKDPIVKKHLCPFFPSKFEGLVKQKLPEILELN
ncbi:MAG: integrase [Flavobacterium sp.]|nr:MAG: integrase [Flavobacterium sp.]